MPRYTRDKFSLSNDRATALELLRLQEAAILANERYIAECQTARRRKNITHLIYAKLSFCLFLVVAAIETLRHVHHEINRSQREMNSTIPLIPEQKNPFFFAYPACLAMSLIHCILWLTAPKCMIRNLLLVGIGTAAAGILVLNAGIAAMRHAEKYISKDLKNENSERNLLLHPIFIHNFTICVMSLFAMLLYFMVTYFIFEHYKWEKNHKSVPDSRKANQKDADDVNEPVLYCCCINSRSTAKQNQKCAHEFQVIQVM